MIQRMPVVDPNISSVCIVSQLPNEVQIGARTVRRRLHDEFDLKGIRPTAKPSHSAQNINDRMKFFHKYKHWTIIDWCKVMFTDELSIRQYANYATHVWRQSGKRFDSRCTVQR